MKRLLVKNTPNTWRSGEVLGIFEADHQFGALESKTVFIERGGLAEDWPRHFVIVNVSNAEDGDLDYLMEEPEESPSSARRATLIPPQGVGSPLYQDLLEFAEVTVNIGQLNALM